MGIQTPSSFPDVPQTLAGQIPKISAQTFSSQTIPPSVSSTMIYRYCNRYYLLQSVSVTIYVLVTTTDNYLESLLTLTTLASSLECSTLTHINCLLLSFTPTFIVCNCIVYVAICQLF